MYGNFSAARAALLLLSAAIGACGVIDSNSNAEASPADAAAASADVVETSARRNANGLTSKPSGSLSNTTTSAGTTNVTTTSVATASTADGSATAAASLKALSLGGLTPSGPVVIDGRTNVTISGLRISNPSGPCVVIRNGSSGVTLTGNAIGPCGGHGIEILGATEITVAGNNITGIAGTGVKVQDSNTVRVRNNFVDGAYTAYRGIRSTALQMEFNAAINVRGPYPDGQFMQLDSVTGSGNRVQCNAADLSIGAPDPNTATSTAYMRTEDIINTWQSHGDPNDPILIAYNRLMGGGSFTGSGIMAGDGGGTNISVVANRIVNPWNAGIGVAGGTNIRIDSNRIFTDLPGRIANEGLYVRNFGPGQCTNITHQNNQILWAATDWSTAGWTQTYWAPQGECSNISGTATNNLSAKTLSRAIFTEPIAECRARAAELGLSSAGF